MTQQIDDLIPFFEHWKGLPHQRAAIRQLWEAVPASLKVRSATWCQTWEAAGKQAQPRALSNPLQVPYYSQRDSATEHALRMCFSSSCAMLLEAMRPGTLQGANADDAYLGRPAALQPPEPRPEMDGRGTRHRLGDDRRTTNLRRPTWNRNTSS